MPAAQRPCCFCHNIFTPNKFAGDRQVVCFHEPCRKAAKKQRQADWFLRNPNYFSGPENVERVRHWSALEKGLAAGAFNEPVSLVLYDLTSVYFEGAGPEHFARYGHSRDHRSDRPQIILAVATDTTGTPLHLSVLWGNRADTSTLQSFLKILQRLKAHKYFACHVDASGILRWERKAEAIAAESSHDGWYLLHTNLTPAQSDAPGVQRHYKNLLEVEEAFCELKSYLKVRPVFHRKAERVLNHVRICFLAYWISARLASQWRTCGETGEVTRILRELQTIRLGQISIGKSGAPSLARLTKVPAHLNTLLAKLNLLHLFAAPPK